MAKRGRRPLEPGEMSAVLAVRVSSTDYDRLNSAARNERLTLAEYVRRELARPFRKLKSPASIH